MAVSKDIEKGTWTSQVWVEDWQGKKKHKKKRGFATKKEALEWEHSILLAAKADMNMKLADFVDLYFRDKETELKARTVRNKRYMIEQHVAPMLGDKPMDGITPADIIQWQNYIRSKGFKETYQRMLQNQLTALFTHATKIYNLKDNLSDYMADISHQLKTPITSMMIMADLLEEAEPGKQAEFIHNIQVSLNKMEWLVGALLKMAKLDSHVIDFIKKDINTSELLEAVKPSVAILLDINNQTIKLKRDCVIHCDKRWTVEALTNIIKNAIEYSSKDSVIAVDSGENPMYSWISVKDSGMGMDKTEYAALFKRFENSTNENGFGIGMPLALSIVKGQGGDIDVDFGGDGQGTTWKNS